MVGTVQTGLETLAQIAALHPDVVTLDIDMRRLNGLETLKRVMSEAPHPAVIIVSALARDGARATIEALELGTFDCIAKQLSYASADVLKVQNELVGKIKAAAGPRLLACAPSRLDRTRLRPATAHCAPGASAAGPSGIAASGVGLSGIVPSIIAICTSTGGPKALQEVLRALPADFPAGILIVQHMPIGFTGPYAGSTISVRSTCAKPKKATSSRPATSTWPRRAST